MKIKEVRCHCKTGKNYTMIGTLENGIFNIRVKGKDHKIGYAAGQPIFCPECDAIHYID